MFRPAILVATAGIFLALDTAAFPFTSLREPQPPTHYPRCNRTWFTGTLPAGATLENVTAVQEGGSYGEGKANVAYSTDPTNLPALCAVTVRVKSSRTSSYRFGLFLPDKWNSRFLVVGNGGFAGGINWLDMAAGPRYGMASLSTDTGHNSTATDSSWARNQPEKKTDWGWRAMHGSTVLGKKLVRAYYAHQLLTYTYYSGCSTGGRQGLKELQKFPDSFDGALIGAPAWWTSHLNNYITKAGLYNLPVDDPKRLSSADVALLADEVTRQCDEVDGVADGIVSSPDSCTLNLARLLCGSDQSHPNTTNPRKCLTRAQLATARNIYTDWTNTTHLLHPGLTPGSERQWHLILNGTEPSPYGVGYARNFLFDDLNPNWDWQTDFNESVVSFAEEHDPGDATADNYAALAAVRRRGGKVVVYHGLADGLVPAKGTGVFYERTVEALASSVSGGGVWGGGSDDGVDDFLRMFFVPGMQHCWNTSVDAPWNFAGAFQAGAMGSGMWSVPGFEDAEHDAMMALMDWVEKGKAVEKIVATTWVSPMDPASGVRRQRPVCAWPRTTVWDGVGDVDVAGSWRCEELR